MAEIPRDRNPESTLALAVDGYDFISKRCRRNNSDVFQTRLMLQKAICMTGEEAARTFYDTERFRRKGAAPKRVQRSLFGEGGVQTLDGETHRNRKAMFMSLMTPDGIERLVDFMEEEWRAALTKWETMDEIVLFFELHEVLTRAVCRWAGVPLDQSEVEQRADDFAAMIDSPGAVGPRHWRGRFARRRAEKWIGTLVRKVRSGAMSADEQSALHAIAHFRDADRELLDQKTAAVEVLNILRPTVAVARYITFGALAVHDNPEHRSKLASGDEEFLQMFVQEVRRYFPFFPSATAKTRRECEWRGYRFPEGVRVLLDLYGTNHDERLWDEPQEFRPERFREWNGSSFNFIPQGGGDHYKNHRCAGEWITIELTKRALFLLTGSMSYDVPDQDLAISKSRMPAIPRSRFLITNVRRA